ncbi:MAG: ABC transporter ATP-binding protein [Anaerolineales bacterium]|jgi:iron(III) transport system ATP-binding protein
MNETAVSISQLSKHFNGTFAAVHALDLEIHHGETLALLGPSGCGKTTTLRLIAGFERPDGGSITIIGNVVANEEKFVPPEKRGVGMVFQEYALFPHMTVIDNVAFGLHGKSNEKKNKTALSNLKLVGLQDLAGRYPHELSGGQRQRIALARALAPRPFLILLDEPFSNMDADLRTQLREEVRVILKGIKATAVFVTHDQEEAMYMGDRIAVMNQGRIEQIGTPEQIFHKPTNRFVAEFMGSTDFLPGIVRDGGIETELGLIPQEVDLPAGTTIELALRADDITFKPQTGSNSIVLGRQFRGALNLFRLRLPSGRLLHAYGTHTNQARPGMSVEIEIDPGHPLAVFYEGEAIY